MTFVISLVPYFTTWVALNINSVPAETMFGLLFVSINILYTLSIKVIYKSNPYNEELQKTDETAFYQMIPEIVIAIGFILTYTIYRPGIYFSCLIAVLMWIYLEWRGENGD